MSSGSLPKGWLYLYDTEMNRNIYINHDRMLYRFKKPIENQQDNQSDTYSYPPGPITQRTVQPSSVTSNPSTTILTGTDQFTSGKNVPGRINQRTPSTSHDNTLSTDSRDVIRWTTKCTPTIQSKEFIEKQPIKVETDKYEFDDSTGKEHKEPNDVIYPIEYSTEISQEKRIIEHRSDPFKSHMVATEFLIPGWEYRSNNDVNFYFHEETGRVIHSPPLLISEYFYGGGDVGLIPGWICRLDQYSGTYYYYHGETNMAGKTEPTIAPDNRYELGNYGLLPGWIRVLDPFSGTHYFYNSGTQKTQQMNPAKLKKEQRDMDLSPEWTFKYDVKSDRCYYFNEDTQKPMWFMPVTESCKKRLYIAHKFSQPSQHIDCTETYTTPASTYNSHTAREAITSVSIEAPEEPIPLSYRAPNKETDEPCIAQKDDPSVKAIEKANSQIQDEKDELDKWIPRVEQFQGRVKNKEYLYLDDSLSKLLIRVNSIDAAGDEKVRLKQKELIKKALETIEQLENNSS